MAYKKNYKPKRKTFKRTYTKKRSGNPSSLKSQVPKQMAIMGKGFPNRIMTKQVYMDTISLVAGAGSVNHYQFILNGLYDPDYTGIGHQPMYFDQYMALYNHYTVIGAKIQITAIGSEGNTVPTEIVLWQNDDTTITPSGSFATQQEQDKSKYMLLGSGGDSKGSLSLKWSAKKTFSGSTLNNSLLRGSSSANPSETSVACIGIRPADNVTNVQVFFQVKIEFISVYYELKDIAGS